MYIGLDSQGTEVTKGRFPTTCEGLNEFTSILQEGAKVAIETSTSGIFVYEQLEGRGESGTFGTSGLCQAICEEACEDRQNGCEGVSAIVEDGLLAGELCSRERDKGPQNASARSSKPGSFKNLTKESSTCTVDD